MFYTLVNGHLAGQLAAYAAARDDIVAAARELYEEQGLSKTSVQDLSLIHI